MDERQPRLAKGILSYYVEHPGTVESPEGLARWRLLEQYVEETTRETEKALAWLVGRGFLTEVSQLGGRRMFVLNATRLEDARTLVTASVEDTDGRR
jgi:hypothetical protein